MTVKVLNGEISEEEVSHYVDMIKEKYSDSEITEILITVDGDSVNIETHKEPKKFQRIRRITGYLVGTLDRFNNGKRAEEHDRVKHTVDEYDPRDYSGLLDE